MTRTVSEEPVLVLVIMDMISYDRRVGTAVDAVFKFFRVGANAKQLSIESYMTVVAFFDELDFTQLCFQSKEGGARRG